GDGIERHLDRERATPRQQFDQSAAFQRAERLAHRSMADAKLRGNLLLGDMLTAAVLAFDNGDGDPIGDLFGNCQRAFAEFPALRRYYIPRLRDRHDLALLSLLHGSPI